MQLAVLGFIGLCGVLNDTELTVGVRLTFVALTALAIGIGTMSSWWPEERARPQVVRVVTSSAVWCGQLGDAVPGFVGLDVDSQPRLIRLRDVPQLDVTAACA